MTSEAVIPGFGLDARVDEERAGLWIRRGSPPRMLSMHRHDDVEINVVLDGQLQYLLAGRPLTVRAGEIAVFWAAQPHGLVDSRPGDTLWIHVPFAAVLAWGLPEAETAPLLSGRPLVVRAPELAARTALLAQQWVHEVPGAAGPTGYAGPTTPDDTGGGALAPAPLDLAELEIRAAVRRILRAGIRPGHPADPTVGGAPIGSAPAGPDAGAQGSPRTGSPVGSAPTARLRHVSAMAQHVREHHREPLTIADIAAAAHLTPSHAMTVFRRTVGVTLGEYVTMCRVAEAQRLLLTTSMTTAEIASAAGFGSLSSFYEHVTAACGMTPREYRRQGR
ncbi:helix-turn-helix domain-containing protein [Brachybacterium sp. J144]|uniref:helix-turn-helix domain-containing protein n=1 Tax=Brachybacterium sp. J144 TaxID=3116487 RepID=UPI002E7793FF|nr:helix-turn-helix domain-containing protein [Brachybacterium sp. J144]MEE1649947.1 helix-turn-helix domain-containing protein [Brachybacterium sp. J144]